LKIENVHLGDIGAPPANPISPAPSSLDARSGLPYDVSLQGPITTQNRICSDNTENTTRPFTSQSYSFYKTIRFSPRGEANINSTFKFRRVGEIGLKPTHGSAIDANSSNVVAIQFAGVSGSVKMYRK
jgi:hypothetical protein